MSYVFLTMKQMIIYLIHLKDKSALQHSRVTLEQNFIQLCTSKDQNLVVGSMSYHGVMEENWEVSCKFFVLISKYIWVDNKTDIKIDKSEMTLANLLKIRYQDEPFIYMYTCGLIYLLTKLSYFGIFNDNSCKIIVIDKNFLMTIYVELSSFLQFFKSIFNFNTNF